MGAEGNPQLTLQIYSIFLNFPAQWVCGAELQLQTSNSFTISMLRKILSFVGMLTVKPPEFEVFTLVKSHGVFIWDLAWSAVGFFSQGRGIEQQAQQSSSLHTLQEPLKRRRRKPWLRLWLKQWKIRCQMMVPLRLDQMKSTNEWLHEYIFENYNQYYIQVNSLNSTPLINP